MHQTSAQYLRIMKLIQKSEWRLKPGKPASYQSFLGKLMCVTTADRYTAEAALKDPWILGDDWTEAHVDSLLAALDDSGIRAVPSSYTEAEWLRSVAAIAQESEGDGSGAEPEPEAEDDEEAGF